MFLKCLDLLLKTKETAKLGHILCPLWSELDILVHALVPEKHVLIAPFRWRELRLEKNGSNLRFYATKLRRLVHRVDFIEDRIGWEFLKLGSEVLASTPLCGRKFELTSRLKAE